MLACFLNVYLRVMYIALMFLYMPNNRAESVYIYVYNRCSSVCFRFYLFVKVCDPGMIVVARWSMFPVSNFDI